MPIQLPRIQEDPNVAQPAPEVRINAQPLNTEAPMQKDQQALEGVGQEVIKYRDQQAQHEADNIATNADNAYQDWHKKKMYGDPTDKDAPPGLIYQEGDPKVLFADFNKQAQAKLKELSTSPDGQDWSDLTQNVVNRRLNRRDQQLQNEELTQYGSSKYKYDLQTQNTAEYFASQRLPGLSTQVDPDHPETFGPLQQGIEDLKAPIIARALQYGGATQQLDDQGKPIGMPILTPAIKEEIAKKVSDGLYKTIDNLYTSDQGDGVAIKQGDAIKAQFADELDPLHKDALGRSNAAAVLKHKALDLAQIIDKNPNDPQIAAAPQEVQQEAWKYNAERGRYMQDQQDLKQKKNMDKLMNKLIPIQNSDSPLTGMLSLQNSDLNRLYNNVGYKNQEAVQDYIQNPKNTSQSAKSKYLNLITDSDPNQKLATMSQQEIVVAEAGMSKAYRDKLEANWQKAKDPTFAQQMSVRNFVAKQVFDQSVGAQIFHKIPNSTNLYNYEQPAFENFKEQVIDGMPDHMGVKEASSYVAQKVAAYALNQGKNPPAPQKFNGSTQAPPPAALQVSSPQVPAGSSPVSTLAGSRQWFGNLTQSAQLQWKQSYMKANGGVYSGYDQLMKYVDQHKNDKGQ